MADLTITPSDVVTSIVDNIKPVISRYTADEIITAGQLVAINNGKAVLQNDGVIGFEKSQGIALNGATIGQPVDLIESGYVNLGAVSIDGEVIVGSNATVGGLSLHRDLVATNPVSIVGFMYSESLLRLNIVNIGIEMGS